MHCLAMATPGPVCLAVVAMIVAGTSIARAARVMGVARRTAGDIYKRRAAAGFRSIRVYNCRRHPTAGGIPRGEKWSIDAGATGVRGRLVSVRSMPAQAFLAESFYFARGRSISAATEVTSTRTTSRSAARNARCPGGPSRRWSNTSRRQRRAGAPHVSLEQINNLRPPTDGDRATGDRGFPLVVECA